MRNALPFKILGAVLGYILVYALAVEVLPYGAISVGWAWVVGLLGAWVGWVIGGWLYGDRQR